MNSSVGHLVVYHPDQLLERESVSKPDWVLQTADRPDPRLRWDDVEDHLLPATRKHEVGEVGEIAVEQLLFLAGDAPRAPREDGSGKLAHSGEDVVGVLLKAMPQTRDVAKNSTVGRLFDADACRPTTQSRHLFSVVDAAGDVHHVHADKEESLQDARAVVAVKRVPWQETT